MDIAYSFISEKGTRANNEDSIDCYIDDIKKKAFFALADGLGGHQSGEIASKTAVETAIKSLQYDNDLDKAFINAQNKVVDLQTMQYKGMRTTLCILKILNDTAYIGHIGDSRIYYFRNDKYIFRTKDHSVPQMLADAGEISEEEIRFNEDRNRLLRVIGEECSSSMHELSAPIKLNRWHFFDKNCRNAFLLCSDGWWELINEKEMSETLKYSLTPEEWLENMKKYIIKAGRELDMDNFSAIAVFINYVGK